METWFLEHLKMVKSKSFLLTIHEINAENLAISILTDSCCNEKGLRYNPGTAMDL